MGAVNPAEHLGLVWMVAKKYQQRCAVPVEDLVQEGAIGLMKAAEKFDPTRGLKFTTYAVWWISAEIARHVSDKSRVVNQGWRRQRAGKAAPTIMSLDASAFVRDEGETTHLEMLADSGPSPEDAAADVERCEIVAREIDRLPKRFREVLRMRFFDGLTLQQIGDLFGRSRERMRQIEAEALGILRPRLEAALS